MLYDTYGEEYLNFLQELNEILSVNELAELDYMQSNRSPLLKPTIMSKQKPDNAAYMTFIESLNEILSDVEINKLSLS